MENEKLIEEAKELADELASVHTPTLVEFKLRQLATALAAATEREKSWADHILLASGGHAKTPLEAMKFIGSVRNMLDVAKGGTKAAVERIRYDVSLVRDRLHSYCEIAETTDDELRSFVPVLQIEECVDDLTKISKENQ